MNKDLSQFKLHELKAIARAYKQHININYSTMNKKDLINELNKHIVIKDNMIYFKKHDNIDVPDLSKNKNLSLEKRLDNLKLEFVKLGTNKLKRELEFEKEQADIGREDKAKIKELETKINARIKRQKELKSQMQELKNKINS